MKPCDMCAREETERALKSLLRKAEGQKGFTFIPVSSCGSGLFIICRPKLALAGVGQPGGRALESSYSSQEVEPCARLHPPPCWCFDVVLLYQHRTLVVAAVRGGWARGVGDSSPPKAERGQGVCEVRARRFRLSLSASSRVPHPGPLAARCPIAFVNK